MEAFEKLCTWLECSTDLYSISELHDVMIAFAACRGAGKKGNGKKGNGKRETEKKRKWKKRKPNLSMKKGKQKKRKLCPTAIQYSIS